MALLEVHDLKKHFPVHKGILSRTVGWVRAVDGVSFSLAEGETLGLVGESELGAITVHGEGCTPGNGTVTGDANDEDALVL